VKRDGVVLTRRGAGYSAPVPAPENEQAENEGLDAAVPTVRQHADKRASEVPEAASVGGRPLSGIGGAHNTVRPPGSLIAVPALNDEQAENASRPERAFHPTGTAEDAGNLFTDSGRRQADERANGVASVGGRPLYGIGGAHNTVRPAGSMMSIPAVFALNDEEAENDVIDAAVLETDFPPGNHAAAA
jgi:hypothetical protein